MRSPDNTKGDYRPARQGFMFYMLECVGRERDDIVIDLLPCPFCGGGVSIALTGDGMHKHWFVTRGIGDHPCKCRVFMESQEFFHEHNTTTYKKELIKAWNARQTNSLPPKSQAK